MFLISDDQAYVLSVIEKTRYMRINQIHRLLRKNNGIADMQYAERVAKQLRYMQKVAIQDDDIAALPHFLGKPTDGDMLKAIDIMLDLTEKRILAVSTEKPPFKLCFLTENESEIKSFAVAVVPGGNESIVNFQMEEVASDKRTVFFLLSGLEQRDLLHTSLPHFFALFDGEKLRYFKSRA